MGFKPLGILCLSPMTSRILCQGPRSQPVRAAAATSTKAPPALNRNFFHETHNRPSSSSSSSSSSPTVDLSFDLYTPARPKVPGPSHNPIIFLHGLFGSRRNNRSISKILAQDTGRYVYALVRKKQKKKKKKHHSIVLAYFPSAEAQFADHAESPI